MKIQNETLGENSPMNMLSFPLSISFLLLLPCPIHFCVLPVFPSFLPSFFLSFSRIYLFYVCEYTPANSPAMPDHLSSSHFPPPSSFCTQSPTQPTVSHFNTQLPGRIKTSKAILYSWKLNF
jgi:hypothetical protein